MDHAWTFQSKWAQRQLEVISGLAERIGGLMGLIEASKQEAAASDSDTYDADSESGEAEVWFGASLPDGVWRFGLQQ